MTKSAAVSKADFIIFATSLLVKIGHQPGNLFMDIRCPVNETEFGLIKRQVIMTETYVYKIWQFTKAITNT